MRSLLFLVMYATNALLSIIASLIINFLTWMVIAVLYYQNSDVSDRLGFQYIFVFLCSMPIVVFLAVAFPFIINLQSRFRMPTIFRFVICFLIPVSAAIITSILSTLLII